MDIKRTEHGWVLTVGGVSRVFFDDGTDAGMMINILHKVADGAPVSDFPSLHELTA